MTRARLEGMTLPLLQELMEKEGLESSPQAGKDELVEILWETYEEDRKEKESLYNLISRIEEAKFALFEPDDSQDRGNWKPVELPENYDDTFVGMVLRDPDWSFVYWEVKETVLQEVQKEYGYKGLILRLFETAKPHLTQAEQQNYLTISLEDEKGSQYVNLPERDRYYMVELRPQLVDKDTRLLARSSFIYNLTGRLSHEIPSGKEGESRRKLLELSGWAHLESGAGTLVEDPPLKRRIPQRIGDME